MSRLIHGLFLPLEFPGGIAPGEGGDYNTLTIARNGKDQPVLRGTALAGALRHAYWQYLLHKNEPGIILEVQRFFGAAAGDEEAVSKQESLLKVSDSVLDLGQSAVLMRTYHLRNRHTGAVADGGLFTMEVCPPGTRTTVALWLHGDAEESEQAVTFLKILVECLEHGITLGGKAARGLGLVRLADSVVYRCYQLANVEEHADWLNDYRNWQRNPTNIPAHQEAFEQSEKSPANILEVSFTLGIPRGQDVLVGDGQGEHSQIEPQRVQKADGKLYWRLPGSSLRGLFRGWVTRLAAREGKPVADNILRYQHFLDGELPSDLHAYTGNNIGWGFTSEKDRREGKRPDCPVSDLFGSLFKAGRLHLSDAYAECSTQNANGFLPEEQLRMHVAVDRLTGGAAESMLFDNTVLTAYPNGKSPAFHVKMRIKAPTQDDMQWLKKTLRALDMGILRVGSSKSSGRLALVTSPIATGAQAEQFSTLQPQYTIEV